MPDSYIWKKIQMAVETDNPQPISYEFPIRLYKNNIAVGDYAINTRSKDCNVILYIERLLNVPGRMYNTPNERSARQLLMLYAETGVVPNSQGTPTESMPTLENPRFHFGGVLDAE